MCLLHAVAQQPDSSCRCVQAAPLPRPAHVPDFTVMSIDHGLRDASAREGDFVTRYAKLLGAETNRRALAMPPGKKSAIMGTARRQRYRHLAWAAQEAGASAILTAHHAGALYNRWPVQIGRSDVQTAAAWCIMTQVQHSIGLLCCADDQAETYLHRKQYGSGPLGLAGMRAHTAVSHLMSSHEPAFQQLTVIRPFLNFAKARLKEYCTLNGVPWMEDPTNQDATFRRVQNRLWLQRARRILCLALHAHQRLCCCVCGLLECCC
jgi:tRNA(Ile)-lysidine synthase